MLTPVTSSRFKRDARKMEKRGKDMRKLRDVLTILIEESSLPDTIAIMRCVATGQDFGTFISSLTGSFSIGSSAASFCSPGPARMPTCSVTERCR